MSTILQRLFSIWRQFRHRHNTRRAKFIQKNTKYDLFCLFLALAGPWIQNGPPRGFQDLGTYWSYKESDLPLNFSSPKTYYSRYLQCFRKQLKLRNPYINAINWYNMNFPILIKCAKNFTKNLLSVRSKFLILYNFVNISEKLLQINAWGKSRMQNLFPT